MTTETPTRIGSPADDKPTTLVIRNRDVGFFSNVNAVVDCLVHRLGRDGVEAVWVEWRTDDRGTQFPYGTAEDGNLWFAFFKRIPFPNYSDRVVATNTFANFSVTWRAAYAAYKLKRRWRQRYHSAYARHIKPQGRILDRVERIYRDSMDGHYCVGVHWRHPDHDRENLFPIPGPDVFVERAKKLLPRDRPWRVFLATDTQAAVAVFNAAFGDRLVVQPAVARAESASGRQLHHGHESPSIALGEQALVDCLLLARCDVLLHVTSNVATAAGYINPDMKMIYCEAPHQAAIGYLWAIGQTVSAIRGKAVRALTAPRAAMRSIMIQCGVYPGRGRGF